MQDQMAIILNIHEPSNITEKVKEYAAVVCAFTSDETRGAHIFSLKQEVINRLIEKKCDILIWGEELPRNTKVFHRDDFLEAIEDLADCGLRICIE